MAEWPPAPADVASAGVAIAAVPERARYSLRMRDPVGVPARVLSTAPFGDGDALCLGPDEWLLVLPAGSAVLPIDALHALTDVSDRNVAVEITDANAAMLVQCGCALDLDAAAFPVGKVTRTVYEGIEIVLWRRADDRFHVEVWRSFAPYLWRALVTAAADL